MRERLIDLAEAEIAQNGTGALRARTLAEQAGCAVGAIYTVVPDMQHLILEVNIRTFIRLGKQVTRAIETRDDAPPLERLLLMADAYIDFAQSDLRLWRAMFEIEMTTDSDVPQWYLDELAQLFRIISQPVGEVDPGASPETVELRTRTLFAAVHGVMLLSFERRLSGIPIEQLKPMIGEFLTRYARP